MKFILILSFCMFNYPNLYSQVLSNYLFQKWIHAASNDPYNGIQISYIDTSIYKNTIEFLINSDFLINDNSNNSSGIWKWNKDSSKIGIQYLKSNNSIYDAKPITEYRMYIYKLTKDSLIIGGQGRHGICRDFYLPVRNGTN